MYILSKNLFFPSDNLYHIYKLSHVVTKSIVPLMTSEGQKAM